MNKTFDFKMWGERGLVATFFADLCQSSDPEAIKDFLEAAQFPESLTRSSGDLEQFLCIIEPDFGNKGFGHPDVILGIKYSDCHIIVIVEAKRTVYEKACKPSTSRGRKGYNSTLNGQLELDFCLAMALSQYKQGDSRLEEPGWILNTPYKQDREGILRYVKNANVLKELVVRLSGEDLGQYYYLIITTDIENPLNSASENLLPELFIPELSGIRMDIRNVWADYRRQFGWMNYDSMIKLVHRIQNRLPAESLFIPTYEMNVGSFGELPNGDEDNDDGDDDGNGEELQLEPPLWGVWIVKFENRKCQLSCQKFSYALSYLHSGKWIELDRARSQKDGKKMLKLLSHVKVLRKAPKRMQSDILFWEKFFKDLGDC